MFTDPTRIKMTDPGHPETCNVCHYWRVFAPEAADKAREECRTSKRGCTQNKQELAEKLIAVTEKFRIARDNKKSLSEAEQILRSGARKARQVARQTMAQVRRAVGLPAEAALL